MVFNFKRSSLLFKIIYLFIKVTDSCNCNHGFFATGSPPLCI